MRVCVILNPYAHRRKAGGQRESVELALRTAGVDFTIFSTAASGDAERLAREARDEGFSAVVAAGGDGTVSEVVNGLLSAAGDESPLPLGVLPIGTGNDFSDMAGLPRELDAATRIIAAGRTRAIDTGRVNERFFDNNSAVGMEPLVTVEAARVRRLKGNARYMLGLLQALRKLGAWPMRISWDDGSFEGRVFLMSVCNSPRTGGLFRMCPPARMDDGLLDFVLIPETAKWRVVGLLTRILRGTHLGSKRVMHGRSRRIVIESDRPTALHADGEVLSEGLTRVEYEVLPGRLRMFCE